MNRPKENTSKNRVLNVLYFVDANKTKSFKMSLTAIYALTAALVVLVSWSGVSTWLLVDEFYTAQYRQERITQLRATIFNYQKRYDAIYERSYPTSGAVAAGKDSLTQETEAFGSSSISKSAVINKPLPPQKDAVASTASQAPVRTKGGTKGEKKNKAQSLAKTADKASTGAIPTAVATTQPAVTKDKPKPKVKPFGAVLEAISGVATAKKKVEIEFSIRNNKKPRRASGYVFARATFEQNGKSIIRTAPAGPNFDKVDRPIRAQGYKFSIRSFTRKNIALAYPPGDDAKLTKLELLMWSSKKLEKSYPVDMAKVKLVVPKPQPDVVSTPSTNPLPTAKAKTSGFPAAEPFQSSTLPATKGGDTPPSSAQQAATPAADTGETSKEIAKEVGNKGSF